MNDPAAIADFLSGQTFAVVGASNDRGKYGNKVLRSFLQAGRKAYPVNPRGGMMEGLTAYPDLASLPETVHGISVIVSPAVTLGIVEEAARLGIRHIWMQPGAESPEALRRAAELNLSVIAEGPCVLVSLGFRDV